MPIVLVQVIAFGSRCPTIIIIIAKPIESCIAQLPKNTHTHTHMQCTLKRNKILLVPFKQTAKIYGSSINSFAEFSAHYEF